jgi:hypothetical protein
VDGYSVYIETRAPAGPAAVLDDTVWDAFADALATMHGTLAQSHDRWSAQVSVDAKSASDATNTGVGAVLELARFHDVPIWPVVRVEVTRADVLDEQLARPVMPEVVSGPEAADILGVSTQRVHQLAVENSQFPAPVYDLRAGKIWLRSAVEAFAARERRPGRPRRVDVA